MAEKTDAEIAADKAAADKAAADKNKKLADMVKENPALQVELNTMMADNRKKLTSQNQELVIQLEQLRSSSNLTQDDRDALQVRISQLEEQYMSKEELTKRESGKKEKKYQEDLTAATKNTESWKGLYTRETIDRSLQDAAIAGEAMHPSQLVEILRSRTQLVEVHDESGKATGKYTPIIKFNSKNDEGKPVVLDLNPTDAIKHMKELPDVYGNLFKGTAAGGLGGTGGTGGKGTGTVSLESLRDPVKYAAWRKKNPDLDFSKIRR